MEALWTALPQWIQLGRDLALAEYTLPEPFRASALEKLLPESLEKDLIGRVDLKTFEQKLKWVTAHVEHSRGRCWQLGRRRLPRRRTWTWTWVFSAA